MQKLIQLELNEVNFEYVRAYGARGELPRLNALIDRHGLTETESERDYDHLEPWIQWVTAHTGLTYAQHGVFRLGDIVERDDIVQIWETLENAGHRVGAISPMNARNNCADPAFFVPDPWTSTKITGSPLTRRLYRAIVKMVNNNADASVDAASLGWLAAGLVRFARPANYPRYASLLASSRRRPWNRALILDLLLTDLFTVGNQRTRPAFSTLFLNAAAHIQHHYMFNAAVYDGSQNNPDWYVTSTADPLLDVYRLYDMLVGQIVDAFPDHRVLVATGLHQDPYPQTLFYWRLRDHASFLRELDIPHERVEPRMSRDFVVYCTGTAQALEAERLLSAVVADEGQPLFQVHNRGESLFVILTYPGDIASVKSYHLGNRQWSDLSAKTVFVALKNGEHNGHGYLVDTARRAASHPARLPLSQLHQIALDHFALETSTSLAA